MRERAVALGWPADQIVVIDSDQGQSGATATGKAFRSWSPPWAWARSAWYSAWRFPAWPATPSDWHRLLEICALTDTLILDEDGLYNPAHFNDRLLLGLKGTMSEAELHVLRARLIGGQLAKASRGELEMKLPVGLVNDAAGHVILDPDLQVQNAVRTFFDTFRRTGSATATVRSFREQGLLFPRRLSTGPHKGEVAWGTAACTAAPAGCCGTHGIPAPLSTGGAQTRRSVGGKELRRLLPRDRWHTVILNAHADYISWEDYEENLRRLHENAQACGADRRKSPPREGPALLQGLAICGRCGRRMGVRYYVNRHGELFPEYICQKRAVETTEPVCQRFVGAALDRAIGDLLVTTLTPLAVEVALAVQEELQARADEADRLRRQQVERARYEAELAQRRYIARRS